MVCSCGFGSTFCLSFPVSWNRPISFILQPRHLPFETLDNGLLYKGVLATILITLIPECGSWRQLSNLPLQFGNTILEVSVCTHQRKKLHSRSTATGTNK